MLIFSNNHYMGYIIFNILKINYKVMETYLQVILVAALIIVFLTICKCCVNGRTNKYKPNLFDKVVIITGSNTGIGYETALEIAKLKPKVVVLACRNQKRG